jgi:S1-C subfamily serine protease
MVIVNSGRGGAEGSAFVIRNTTDASYMVTNNHVVDGATRIQVLMLDGRHWVASVQGADALGDIAVLKVPDPKLPAAEFGDSSKLGVGQRVVAIGSPLGNQGSVTSGIVSSLHRTITASTGGSGRSSETLPDVIQTDAAINPGSSGGPLADALGRVVGVNTAGDTQRGGIGYAIPSLVAKRIAEALIAGRPVGHPYLGICYATMATALAANREFPGYGIMVDRALTGTPAERSGLRAGDVIEKVDGIDLNNGQTLGGLLAFRGPGDQVRLTVLRGASTVELPLTLADRPANPAAC